MTQAKYIYKEELYLITLQHKIAADEIKVCEDLLTGNELFSKRTPFFYNGRLRISLIVSDGYKQRFALVKGLIEFHRVAAFSFKYHSIEKLIEADIPVELAEELEEFLFNVLQWTKHELAFKERLKQVLKFEREYKSLAACVYDGLMKSAGM
jgi:hypothetical protein